ncbi:Uncharacterized protein FWK35_00004517 [Aphis craccivora]|uniref:Uncharacterized protein n=1 Tax=Aphis craccivora TaxID=307492 RepID=A0A6G0ZM52_APHCR|nr:Uncharacterized protein FWK35_00004517 [Aphis craccivora]
MVTRLAASVSVSATAGTGAGAAVSPPRSIVCAHVHCVVDRHRTATRRTSSSSSSFGSTMDPATVALILLSFSALAVAGTGKPRGAFGYPDDDHVIITQYGPMRYEPITADQMNRPYDADDGAAAKTASSGRGYYKAEVIPLDMNTWKPAAGADGHWVGRAAAGGRADSFDVPLRVGYSVRPAARRRRHDYLLMGYRPRPQWNHRDLQPVVPRRRVDTVPPEVPIRPR